jgi:hypothetical protein
LGVRTPQRCPRSRSRMRMWSFRASPHPFPARAFTKSFVATRVTNRLPIRPTNSIWSIGLGADVENAPERLRAGPAEPAVAPASRHRANASGKDRNPAPHRPPAPRGFGNLNPPNLEVRRRHGHLARGAAPSALGPETAPTWRRRKRRKRRNRTGGGDLYVFYVTTYTGRRVHAPRPARDATRPGPLKVSGPATPKTRKRGPQAPARGFCGFCG